MGGFSGFFTPGFTDFLEFFVDVAVPSAVTVKAGGGATDTAGGAAGGAGAADAAAGATVTILFLTLLTGVSFTTDTKFPAGCAGVNTTGTSACFEFDLHSFSSANNQNQNLRCFFDQKTHKRLTSFAFANVPFLDNAD